MLALTFGSHPTSANGNHICYSTVLKAGVMACTPGWSHWEAVGPLRSSLCRSSLGTAGVRQFCDLLKFLQEGCYKNGQARLDSALPAPSSQCDCLLQLVLLPLPSSVLHSLLASTKLIAAPGP